MQVDILGVRIVFGFLTVAMLILVHGLLFNYDLIILAPATSCMAAFFFITAVSAKKLAQSNYVTRYRSLGRKHVRGFAIIAHVSAPHIWKL